MSHDTLKAIEEELERQNLEFAEFKRNLESLGDVVLRVGPAFFEPFEALTTPHTYVAATPLVGIRV